MRKDIDCRQDENEYELRRILNGSVLGHTRHDVEVWEKEQAVAAKRGTANDGNRECQGR